MHTASLQRENFQAAEDDQLQPQEPLQNCK